MTIIMWGRLAIEDWYPVSCVLVYCMCGLVCPCSGWCRLGRAGQLKDLIADAIEEVQDRDEGSDRDETVQTEVRDDSDSDDDAAQSESGDESDSRDDGAQTVGLADPFGNETDI